jgi:hypothetical protein
LSADPVLIAAITAAAIADIFERGLKVAVKDIRSNNELSAKLD